MLNSRFSSLLAIFHRTQHSMRRRLQRGSNSEQVPFSVPNGKRDPAIMHHLSLRKNQKPPSDGPEIISAISHPAHWG